MTRIINLALTRLCGDAVLIHLAFVGVTKLYVIIYLAFAVVVMTLYVDIVSLALARWCDDALDISLAFARYFLQVGEATMSVSA